MKKIISSKGTLISLSFCCFIASFLSLVSFGLEISESVEEAGAGIFCFACFLALDLILFWVLNRLCCVIWIENGTLKRRGLLGGFYAECKIENIKAVFVSYAYREGNFIYIADSYDQNYKKFLRIRNASYISFSKSKKNLEFLRSFWAGEIKDLIPLDQK